MQWLMTKITTLINKLKTEQKSTILLEHVFDKLKFGKESIITKDKARKYLKNLHLITNIEFRSIVSQFANCCKPLQVSIIPFVSQMCARLVAARTKLVAHLT